MSMDNSTENQSESTASLTDRTATQLQANSNQIPCTTREEGPGVNAHTSSEYSTDHYEVLLAKEKRKIAEAQRDKTKATEHRKEMELKDKRALRRETRRKMKSERRRNNMAAFNNFATGLSRGGKIAIAIVAIIAVTGIIFSNNAVKARNAQPTIVTSSELEKVVGLSDLYTATFVYNGIATYKDEKGSEKYHIQYIAHVDAGIDMSQIHFDTDDENKIIYPIIPEITIQNPVVDSNSIEFFEENPNLSIPEIRTLCQEDALEEAQKTDLLYNTAKENLRNTIKALLTPIADSRGYQVKWEKPESGASTEGAAPATDTTTEENSYE